MDDTYLIMCHPMSTPCPDPECREHSHIPYPCSVCGDPLGVSPIMIDKVRAGVTIPTCAGPCTLFMRGFVHSQGMSTLWGIHPDQAVDLRQRIRLADARGKMAAWNHAEAAAGGMTVR